MVVTGAHLAMAYWPEAQPEGLSARKYMQYKRTLSRWNG
jgi:hypothetical protein